MSDLKLECTDFMPQLIAESKEPDPGDIDVIWLRKLAKDWITMRNALLQREWVSVDERLPEGEHPVLVSCPAYPDGVAIMIGNYQGSEMGWCADNDRYTVSHWMPLPDAPAGE